MKNAIDKDTLITQLGHDIAYVNGVVSVDGQDTKIKAVIIDDNGNIVSNMPVDKLFATISE